MIYIDICCIDELFGPYSKSGYSIGSVGKCVGDIWV